MSPRARRASGASRASVPPAGEPGGRAGTRPTRAPCTWQPRGRARGRRPASGPPCPSPRPTRAARGTGRSRPRDRDARRASSRQRSRSRPRRARASGRRPRGTRPRRRARCASDPRARRACACPSASSAARARNASRKPGCVRAAERASAGAARVPAGASSPWHEAQPRRATSSRPDCPLASPTVVAIEATRRRAERSCITHEHRARPGSRHGRSAFEGGAMRRAAVRAGGLDRGRARSRCPAPSRRELFPRRAWPTSRARNEAARWIEPRGRSRGGPGAR